MSKKQPELDKGLITSSFINWPELGYLVDSVFEASKTIFDSFASGGKLLVCGNGGSAADAEHIVGELAKSYKRKRPLTPKIEKRLVEVSPQEGAMLAARLETGLPAISLVSQTSLITAVMNDIDGSVIFAQQVVAYAKEGDCLMGLSTSGASSNVINAFIAAAATDVTTISLTGSNPGPLGSHSDIVIAVPSIETAAVQQYHQIVYHTLCEVIEAAFFPDGNRS